MRSLFLSALTLLILFSSCSGPGKLRAPVKLDGKYGYIDESGDFVIDPQYEEAWAFLRGNAIVKKNGKYGLIDKKGKFVVEPQYDSVIPFSSACCVIEKDSSFGFLEYGDGKVVLAPQFEKVFYYTDDLCVVQKGYALGIVNKEGKIVCPVIMQHFEQMLGPAAKAVQQDTSDVNRLLLSLVEGGAGSRYGLINSKGEIIAQPEFDEIFDADMHEGFYYTFVRSPDVQPSGQYNPDAPPVYIGKYGILDTTGKVIAKPQFDELPVYGDEMFRVRVGKFYGFADRSGKVVIEPKYDFAVAFSEGKTIVSIGNTASIIDKRGNVLVENLGPGAGLYRFFNGLARCRSVEGHEYGFLDATGKRVIPPVFTVADDFGNNRAIVGTDGKYGLIDRNGNFVLKMEHEFIYDLQDGLYQVKDEGQKAGVVDSNGKEILPAKFDEVFHLQKNFLSVEQNSLNGCYDLHGKEIYPPTSEKGIYFFNGRTEVRSNGKSGIIDSTGKFIVPLQYDSIGIFYKGYATVLQNTHFGTIDSTGKVVIAPAYDELRPFVNGYAVFRKGDKYGYLDLSGKVIVDAKFEEAAVLVDPDRKEFE